MPASYTFGKTPLDFQTFQQCRIHQKKPTLLHHACTRLHAAYTPSARRYVPPHNRATTTTRNANGRAEFLSEQQKFRPPVNDKRALTSPKTTCHNPLKYRYVPLFPPCANNRLCRRQCRQRPALPTLRNSMIFNLLHPKSVRCRKEQKNNMVILYQYANAVIFLCSRVSGQPSHATAPVLMSLEATRTIVRGRQPRSGLMCILCKLMFLCSRGKRLTRTLSYVLMFFCFPR